MSGIGLGIKVDTRVAKAFLSELGDAAVRRAASNSLNVVARTVRNTSIDEVAKIRRVKRSTIKQNIVLAKRARNSDLLAIIKATGGSISLKDYSAKAIASGVRINVEGRPTILYHAFIGRGGNVFERRAGKHRVGSRSGGTHEVQRIHKLWGPSISTGFIKDVVRQSQRRVLERDWRRVFNAKLEDQLTKLRAKHGGRG